MTGRLANGLLGALGIALFLVAWEIVGRTGFLGISWPPLSDVLELLADESRFPLFSRALGAPTGPPVESGGFVTRSFQSSAGLTVASVNLTSGVGSIAWAGMPLD